MITEKSVRPIPKHILKAIMKKDKQFYPSPAGTNRFYAYLSIWKKELVKVTVAMKHHQRKWYCKQVAVHGLHSEKCFVRDLEYCYLTGMGFRVGWHSEGIQHYSKWFEDGKWYTANDNGTSRTQPLSIPLLFTNSPNINTPLTIYTKVLTFYNIYDFTSNIHKWNIL